MSDKLLAVTSANAEGVAVADFDMARFSATTSAVGSTGKEAKDSLKKTVDKMVSLYDSLKAEGVAENLRTNVSVQPKHEYHRNGEPKLVGYEAKYSMVFHTPDLDKVSKEAQAAAKQVKDLSVKLKAAKEQIKLLIKQAKVPHISATMPK